MFFHLIIFFSMLTIIHYTSGFSEVIMEYAEEIKGITNLTDFSKIKVSKVNRTTHLWMGDMTLFVDVGDDYKFESTLFKKVGMGYHKTPYKMGPKDFCKYWNDDAFFYPDMLKVSDLPAQGTWQAKTYHLYGYTVNLNRVPKTFNGQFMIKSTMQKNGQILGGFRVMAAVTQSKQ